MAIIKLFITGVSGILMHNPAGSMRGSHEVRKSGKSIPLPLDEARASLYAMPSGQLYIGSDPFREAGLTAAKRIRDPSRKGRATMVDRFASSIFLSQEYCPLFRLGDNHAPIMKLPEPSDLGDTSGEWTIDYRRAVVVKQGIMRARARIDGWCCPLEFEMDDETIDENLVLAIMQESGKTPGVLDYRVGRKGPFGRFKAEFLNGQLSGDETGVTKKKGARK